MHISRRLVGRVVIVLAVAMIALSAASVALAQSSTNFQLGCWGVVSASGGTRQSPGTQWQLTDSAGQWAVGESSSPSYMVRVGYVHQSGFGAGAVLGSNPAQAGQSGGLYLPLLRNYFRIVYVCPY